MDVSLLDQARVLLARLAAQCSTSQGFGTMSASVYDTAWLSMIRKPTVSSLDGTWLFPECFEFILAQQLPSGGWESYATLLDGILNTAAALLSLKRHSRTNPDNRDLLLRIQKAEAALRQMLHVWDVHLTDQVGFEILVASLLDHLEQEGVSLDFPQLGVLRALRDAKLAKLPLSKLCQAPSTLYHSLEAFIGHVDFDSIHHWREANGSMMASPASTAAYLMNTSSWDDEAEMYLRSVLHRPNNPSSGGVPCAWPTTIFEVSWVVSTLASAGVSIDKSETSTFCRLLQETLRTQKGLLGFSQGTLSDADDTARGLETLYYLGQHDSIEGLIVAFESSQNFITYPGERNPSFGANCNVLTLILLREDRARYLAQIVKATRFLTNEVFRGGVYEKWHLSELYWMMLLVRAFELLFRHYDIALRVCNTVPRLREEISMISLHILMRILRTQRNDGSWGGVCEVTAYGILALSSVVKLPCVQQLEKGKMIAALALGKSFLHANRSEWDKGHYLWIEKVTYSSVMLSEAYCLSAALVPLPSTVQPEQATSSRCPEFLVADKSLLGMRKYSSLLARTPLLSKVELYLLRACEIQASFAMQALQCQPLDVFPRTAKGKDKYMLIIPLALLICAQLDGCQASPSVLYEMMVLSVLNFHADEYMEGVLERYFEGNLDAIRNIVREVVTKTSPNPHEGVTNGCKGVDATSQALDGPQVSHSNRKLKTTNSGERYDPEDGSPSLEDVRTVFRRFVTHILQHPAVLSSPETLQEQLAFELQTFLLAHVTHAEDSHRLSAQWCSNNSSGLHTQGNGNGHSRTTSRMQYRKPGRTFYHWVRSTSADHTSCPFSFIFFNCLVYAASPEVPQARGGILASARTAYLAEDTCRHLSSLCRMYNDLGSVGRDAEEASLNSVNFPEFFLHEGKTMSASTKHDNANAELLWIAEYERRGLDMAMKLLEEELGGSELVEALRLFINVTDLYGQIYVLEDVGTRTR
ncbi:hypothetical protein F4781DRAFT_382493 [Annulohypoxylon bovei var. microspora]|nr:hypothetical protein F4781DRAFT_382493 [Annulohypoxylon bovei var. microspora]